LNGAIPGEIFIRTEENNIGQTWEVIDLSHNVLTGTIPKEISILRNLTHLILDNNADLTGDISCSLLSELVEDINVCQPINHANGSIVNNTVNEAKKSIDNNTNGSIGADLTPGIIATIAVVASCVLLWLFLGVIDRNRRNNRQHQEDEEFLQDVATPRSDGC